MGQDGEEDGKGFVKMGSEEGSESKGKNAQFGVDGADV